MPPGRRGNGDPSNYDFVDAVLFESVNLDTPLPLNLNLSGSAADIYSLLSRAPAGSSAHYLLRALNGERDEGYGAHKLKLRPFAEIADRTELDDALDEGLRAGGDLIGSDFHRALIADIRRRQLVKMRGSKLLLWRPLCWEPFRLSRLLQDQPFQPPFDTWWVERVNNGMFCPSVF